VAACNKGTDSPIQLVNVSTFHGERQEHFDKLIEEAGKDMSRSCEELDSLLTCMIAFVMLRYNNASTNGVLYASVHRKSSKNIFLSYRTKVRC
jgi:hypothetical protein